MAVSKGIQCEIFCVVTLTLPAIMLPEPLALKTEETLRETACSPGERPLEEHVLPVKTSSVGLAYRALIVEIKPSLKPMQGRSN